MPLRTLGLVTSCLALVLTLPAAPGQAAPPESSPPAAAATAGWSLVWQDEFDGTTLDRTRWGFDLGNAITTPDGGTVPGWGNNELECYTDRPENVFVRDGALHLRAIHEEHAGFHYTSGRIQTRGKFAPRYGRIECRARLPVGAGLWPAIWMLPARDAYGSWAASGELDIMEAIGSEPTRVLGTLHFGGKWPANTHTTHRTTLPSGGRIDAWHVYGAEWEPGRIAWSVDGATYATETKWHSTSKTDRQGRGVVPRTDADTNPYPAPFDQPFYLLLNLAVGGNLPGPVDPQVPFPQEMVVDYVRVYQNPTAQPASTH